MFHSQLSEIWRMPVIRPSTLVLSVEVTMTEPTAKQCVTWQRYSPTQRKIS